MVRKVETTRKQVVKSAGYACLTVGLVLLAGLGCERRPKSDPSPLHKAIREGDIERIQSLISHGVNVNQKDTSGRTPLISAIIHDRTRAVEMLLAAGADVNLRSTNGEIPLHQAAAQGRKEGKAYPLVTWGRQGGRLCRSCGSLE